MGGKVMKGLIVKGLAEVEGMKFHHIEGGFGEGKKAILVKEIAAIHNRELREINERINLNRKRFKDGIDIIDLLGIGLTDTEIIEFGLTQQAINSYRGLKTKGLVTGIYILSERGYSKLLKILEDDFAWEQYEKLVDGYFNMRKELKSNINPNLSRNGDTASLIISLLKVAKAQDMPKEQTGRMVKEFLEAQGVKVPESFTYISPWIQENLPVQINVFNMGK